LAARPEPIYLGLSEVHPRFTAFAAPSLDTALEALKARIGSILVAAEKTRTLDEEALAELPAVLADQSRAA
jgi:hypothetical protein